ncbi:MAG TPA: hypothetical protein VKW09_04210 [bacterium]|nr:hypothetical protein [bacterium]
MTDVSWSTWGTIISVVLMVVPALVRLRQHLVKLQDLIIEIVGVVVLLVGAVLYMVTVPQWVPVREQMERLGTDVQSLSILFFGSIAMTMLGAMLTLFGILGRVSTTLKRR